MTGKPNLLQTVRELRKKGRQLARQVEYELARLETTGIAPSSKTLAALAEFQSEFDRLVSVISSPNPIHSLLSMERMLVHSSTLGLVSRVIEPILALQHVDDSAFAPLADLQCNAVKLQREIKTGTVAPEVLETLTEGTHAWCRLLDLVATGDALGDALWNEYFDFVESTLGSGLAIAATRGKLRLPPRVKAFLIDGTPVGGSRDSLSAPRPEDLDPLLINRPTRQPVQETPQQQTIFDEAQVSGVNPAPGADDLSELDALEDPDGKRFLIEDDFDESSLDREVDDLPTFIGAGLAQLESAGDDDVDSGDSMIVPSEILTSRTSVSLPESHETAAVAGGATPEHSDEPRPCPKCGEDIFPAMARCRGCGLVLRTEPAAAPEPSTVSGLFRTAPAYAVDSSEFELPRKETPAASGAPVSAPAPLVASRSSGDSEFDEAGFVLPGTPAPVGNRTVGTSGGTAVLPAPTRQQIAAARTPAAEPAAPPAEPAPVASVAASAASGSSRASGTSAASGSRRSGVSSRSSGRSFQLKSGGQAAKLKTICDKCTADFAVSRSLEGQPVICPACGETTLAPMATTTSEVDMIAPGTDIDITLYTVREAIEQALEQKPVVAERSWEKPLTRSQWKNLSTAIEAITPATNPMECERAKPLFEMLGNSNDERAAELLRARYMDLPNNLKTEALKALERLRDPVAIPLVMRSLYEEKSPAVPVAIAALVSFGETRVVPALCLLAVAAPEHRERVLQAFAGFGESIVPHMAQLSEPAEPEAVRFVAFEALGRLQSVRAIPALSAGLKEGNKLIQRVAAEGLAYIRSKKVIRPLIEALQNPDELVRIHASAGLRDNPDPKSAKFLVRSLRDKSLDVRKNIVASMGLCGDESVVGSLKKFLVDPSREMVVVASEAIGRLGQNSAVPTLVKMLEEETASGEDKALIQRIFKALQVLKDRRSLVPLIGYLESTDPMIRRRAVEALGPIQDASARRALENALRSDRADEVRAAAALALGEQGQKHAIPALEAALSGSERVRINALQAIGLLQEKTSVPKVLTLLSDPGFRVRQAAANCLGAIKSPAAVPRLLEMVHDPDDSVRKSVFEALAALGEKRTEQELVGEIKPTRATNPAASTTMMLDTVSLPRPSSGSKRSSLAGLSDFAAGIFGTPWATLQELGPKKIASIASAVAVLGVAVVFFNVQGSGLPPYRRAYVEATSISPDGAWAATGRTSQGVEIWNTASKSVADYNPQLPNRFVTFGASPELLYCVGQNNVVKATLAQGRVSNATDLGTHDDNILKFCSTVNGQFFATTSGRSVRVWSTEQAKTTIEIPYGEGFSPDDVRGKDTSLRSVSISEDGSTVMVVTSTAGARVWQNGKLSDLKLAGKNRLVAGAIRLDGQALLLLDAKGMMTTHDMANGKLTGSIQSPSQARSGLYFLDSKRVLQTYANCVSAFDVTTGEEKKALFDLTKFDAVDLSADQSTVVAGDNEATPLYVIEVNGGALKSELDIKVRQ
ncbi:HEAT repeat domain-containing protein [Planctomyces sp. SH-PL14]|uniref:HEAT repeat domain-containing protein n=1 Tax=Planctomyces sp. SH-PL14 TaxID=1632864 RepID=UPI00078B62D1|nr:HEAT repeat domain-containing protein [Planctomyces sp. SH-PL14]AMV18601.1 putative lyase [Planctomyces sp. SH-PL14]